MLALECLQEKMFGGSPHIAAYLAARAYELDKRNAHLLGYYYSTGYYFPKKYACAKYCFEHSDVSAAEYRELGVEFSENWDSIEHPDFGLTLETCGKEELFREKNGLKLLKRYSYDKDGKREYGDGGYTWSASETVCALDVYDYKGTPYIVETYWYYKGSGDYVDSDRFQSLSFTVYPINSADAYDEEKVRARVASTKGYEKHIGDDPLVNTRDEMAFMDNVRCYIIGAIDAYIADEKKKMAEACGKSAVPNAVRVYKSGAPKAEIICDFGSN
ncbi:MAG: hypothetical protein IJW21_09100, partial [Clostridia bacterium]|nr:hypothetical protein [Clostridia bacterium]